MVQDLRAVDEAIEDVHPIVPNPDALLATLPSTRAWNSVLYLKGAFFCIPLASESQEIFAFEWQDQNTQQKQYYWTVLPTGFKNSPTIFGETLAKDLKDRASLVAQWLRICLPMQGTRVRALVWEDPTCRGANRPMSHNY